jgi:hypothetical protein
LPAFFTSVFGGPGWPTTTPPNLSGTLQQEQENWQTTVTQILAEIQQEIVYLGEDVTQLIQMLQTYVPAYVSLATLPLVKYGVILAAVVFFAVWLFLSIWLLTESERKIVQDLTHVIEGNMHQSSEIST